MKGSQTSTLWRMQSSHSQRNHWAKQSLPHLLTFTVQKKIAKVNMKGNAQRAKDGKRQDLSLQSRSHLNGVTATKTKPEETHHCGQHDKPV